MSLAKARWNASLSPFGFISRVHLAQSPQDVFAKGEAKNLDFLSDTFRAEQIFTTASLARWLRLKASYWCEAQHSPLVAAPARVAPSRRV